MNVREICDLREYTTDCSMKGRLPLLPVAFRDVNGKINSYLLSLETNRFTPDI